MSDEITLQIATSNGVFTGTFSKTTKVDDVIHAVVEDRGLKEGDVFQLYHDDHPLEPVTRPLVSFGLEGAVTLELVATGSGV